MSKRVELAHAGHFICGHMCQMRRATYVNGYIVSTVGEYAPSSVWVGGGFRTRRSDDPFEPIGAGPHLYETYVFHAKRRRGVGSKCCPYVMSDASEIEGKRHMTADEAVAFHEKTVRKYERKKP